MPKPEGIGTIAPVTAHMEASKDEGVFRSMRLAMVNEQLAGQGIVDERVFGAMSKVPRPRFVPWALQPIA